MTSYDWQSIFIGIGSPSWPLQGSNVWPSNGNLHLWHPLQETPATDWEARVDELYNLGSITVDPEEAAPIWDEYQRIVLEQLPVIWLMRTTSFWAIQNKWDQTNLYYDNLDGAQTAGIYIK
jgi:peptide/nickel transport system substrate-binding protein